jgi:hypothetical protein
LLCLEFLIGECRRFRHLDDYEGVIGRRVAGIASFGQAFIGLIELALEVELDRKIEERDRLGRGCVEQVRYGKTLPPGDRS